MQYSSPHFNGKIFLNPVPTEVSGKGALWKILKESFKKHPGRFPQQPPGPFPVDLPFLYQLPGNTLRISWLGHSTTILEIEGKRFLTDPVWYQRASPFTLLGPKRFFDVPVSLQDLPPIDYILLSHDHYDHLDRNTLLHLTSRNIPVICLLGVKDRLTNWGVANNLVTELDWWQPLDLNDTLTVIACPARHFSGRSLNDRFTTLWGSFAIKGTNHSVYFGADSGMYPGFKTIGEKLGPFDLTLLDIGAYNQHWASIHMGPENAVQAHLDLKGKLLMPIHWGTFALAFHPWKEPVERLIKEAAEKDVSLFIPSPGETKNVTGEAYHSNWWQRLN